MHEVSAFFAVWATLIGLGRDEPTRGMDIIACDPAWIHRVERTSDAHEPDRAACTHIFRLTRSLNKHLHKCGRT